MFSEKFAANVRACILLYAEWKLLSGFAGWGRVFKRITLLNEDWNGVLEWKRAFEGSEWDNRVCFDLHNLMCSPYHTNCDISHLYRPAQCRIGNRTIHGNRLPERAGVYFSRCRKERGFKSAFCIENQRREGGFRSSNCTWPTLLAATGWD